MHTPVLAHGCVREIQQLSPLLRPIDVALWTTVSADMPEGLLDHASTFREDDVDEKLGVPEGGGRGELGE